MVYVRASDLVVLRRWSRSKKIRPLGSPREGLGNNGWNKRQIVGD